VALSAVVAWSPAARAAAPESAPPSADLGATPSEADAPASPTAPAASATATTSTPPIPSRSTPSATTAGTGGGAEAMSAEARAHYDRGIELYTAKDYGAAIRELAAGYAIDPRREFLFAQAQALRLSGDCKGAVPLYQQFLASQPPEVQVNATHIGLGRCAQQMATAAPPAAAVAAPVPTAIEKGPAPPAPRSPARPEAPAPWYHDRWGAVLLGAGGLALAAGTGFMVASMSARDDANQSAADYPDYARRWDTAQSRWRIAVTGLAVGGALTGAAILRYLHVRRGSRAAPTAEPSPAPRASFLSWGAWLGPAPSGGGGALLGGCGGRF
jgi:hypothetical protein